MKFFFCFCLIYLFCIPSFKKKEESLEEKIKLENWIVTPSSGLNLRESPSIKSKSIRLLPFGSMLIHKLIPENEKEGIIDEQKGKWLKVNYENETGWVFDVYLSKPIFSPNKDKFYFYIITDPETKNIIKSSILNCGSRGDGIYLPAKYDCKISIRTKDSLKSLRDIFNRQVIDWFDNESLIFYSRFEDEGDLRIEYDTINLISNDYTNLYKYSKTDSNNYITGGIGEEYHLQTIICIKLNCYEFKINKILHSLNISSMNNSKNWNENLFINVKLIQKISIRRFTSFQLRELKEEQIIQLKRTYIGTIYFSVEQKNYALDIPTGKITELNPN